MSAVVSGGNGTDGGGGSRRDLSPPFLLDADDRREVVIDTVLDDYRPTPPRVLPDGSRIGLLFTLCTYR